MIVTREQMAFMEEAAKPLIKWLNDNCHPHCSIIVVQDGAELVEGICTVKVAEFLKD